MHVRVVGINQRAPKCLFERKTKKKWKKMVETDLDGAVEEAIVLSGSVEKAFGVGSEDLVMRRMLSHALMFGCLLLLAVLTWQGGGHRHRCRSHDFNPLFSSF